MEFSLRGVVGGIDLAAIVAKGQKLISGTPDFGLQFSSEIAAGRRGQKGFKLLLQLSLFPRQSRGDEVSDGSSQIERLCQPQLEPERQIIRAVQAARQLPEQSTILRVEPSSTGNPRLRGACKNLADRAKTRRRSRFGRPNGRLSRFSARRRPTGLENRGASKARGSFRTVCLIFASSKQGRLAKLPTDRDSSAMIEGQYVAKKLAAFSGL